MGARMQLKNTIIKNRNISFLCNFILSIGHRLSQNDTERDKTINDEWQINFADKWVHVN